MKIPGIQRSWRQEKPTRDTEKQSPVMKDEDLREESVISLVQVAEEESQKQEYQEWTAGFSDVELIGDSDKRSIYRVWN